jgi:hypothetical protein
MDTMSRRSRTLRIIALCAAYVVALQALLLPMSVALGGPLDLTPCTVSASIGSAHAPANHQTGCPCAAGCGMQCCVHAFAPPPPQQIAFDLVSSVAPIPLPALVPAVRTFVRGPQAARAPPAA